ncbi:metallophosphoesterase [Dyadobacter chenwenxiniae]|uniref:Metallophosphoesterase n=1 Tax=Dyadobacter chenwenxiniae TaxID=2906456 RepID=A0A9X1PQP6_9BACT|nr:metallophosphoesterase [Dyadobacter chenwenxiniae]MCF0063156.1 metallophosphoesterase [Dyadobacter chenwenxiniae]UON84677.1 metallophosphoesterase [Dyadobacter chenwenxiniae]
MKNSLKALLLALGMTLTACEGVFQYNPNQVIFKDSETNLNQKNIERIKAIPLKDTVRFILMGDTQRWYDETDAFIKSANSQKDIAFVLHAGDISDFGLSQEFKWVNEIMIKLKCPYLTVIGNHDLVANGPAAYRKIYGPMDYSFEYGDNKFIFINTNSREYIFNGAVPDLNWLKSQLADNHDNKNAIVVAHIPPFDGDFDPKLQEGYAGLLANDPNVKFTLYGHQHTFRDGDFYGDGVHYYLTTSTGERGYWLFTTWKGGYKAEKMTY